MGLGGTSDTLIQWWGPSYMIGGPKWLLEWINFVEIPVRGGSNSMFSAYVVTQGAEISDLSGLDG